jgi:PLP dependent protein
MTELVDSIHERYLQTLHRIATAAKSVGRDPSQIRLVVVTKSQPREVVEAAILAGATILGENYPEEAVEKIQSIPAQSAVEWHMIGHVQSRKARLVPANFNLMQSLDSLKLAERLDHFAAEAGRVLPVLLEFNVGGEDSKSGWPAADETRWNELAASLMPVFGLPHLQVRGLMVMPPIGDEAEASRPFFQRTRRLHAFLRERLPQVDWSEVSMGTSTDFETAVQEGATLVRVGTAIVGPRNYNKS